MRRFSGRYAAVYAFGEPFPFDTYLESCGDGWDWRMPDQLRYWDSDSLLQFFAGQSEADAAEIHYGSGRVTLSRCTDGPVRATGVCRPVTLLGESGGWDLFIEAYVGVTPTLGGELAYNRTGEIVAVLRECPEIPIDSVRLVLPHGPGAFIGNGEAKSQHSELVVNFDSEGVGYVPW